VTHPGWAGDPILADLAAETESLLAEIAGLEDGPEGIDRPTPSDPWTIRDQISHLAGFDEKARVSAVDPDGFMADVATDFADGGGALMERQLAEGRSKSAAEVVGWLRSARSALLAAFAEADPEVRVPWYGPPMKMRSSAVARLMETWAHGVDVVDALGIERAPTARLFHIAELGVKTFRFSFQNRGLAVPEGRARVSLVGPSGEVRTWNEDATDAVSGAVEDFCLVVAQRRNLADTALEVDGPIAEAWMTNAQVFAGPPGPGRSATTTERTQGSIRRIRRI
jgi:uncharacterized protein (TIGR03084 family)